MAYPRITPNSDGAGVVEAVGPGVAASWVGKRVWFYNGQRNGRAFGSAVKVVPRGEGYTITVTLAHADAEALARRFN